MSRPVRSLLPAAEAALVVLSLSVVLGFARLFVDGSFFPRLAAFVLVAHATAIATRRAGWSVATSGVVSLAVLAVTIGIVLYPDSTFLGVPTAETLRLARRDLADIWTQFQSVQAPAPVTTPFLLAAGLALWWSAFVADWAAFRVWVPFESVVPAGTVFVFSSLWAAHQSQVLLSGLFLFAAMGFLLVHRVTRQQSNAGWVSTDVQRGTNSLLRTGATLAIVAVVVAMIIGPNLPQAQSAGVIALRGGSGGPSARTTVSPLVDIAHRLVQQSSVELFTVKSERRSYWRMTALDQFDGQIWKSDGSYESASGRLPESVESSASTAVFKQTYTIGTLDTIWLPAAYEPRSVDKASTEVRYEPATSTLIVGTTVQNSNSVAYSVQSALPIYDPAQLEAAPSGIPDDIAQKDLQLPPDFSAKAAAEAQRVTAGTTTVYDKALALQDYFRNSYTYDLNVPPGHSDRAIDDFIDTKRGYCEQFAGTYAAMARSLGIPARVAVGFTPGDEDPVNPGLYHVRGLHAHAWPEVFITGQGWVLFEPTPGRGAPNTEQYTHVAESQATADGSATTLATTTTVFTPTSTSGSLGSGTTLPNGEVNTGSGTSTKAPEPAFWSTSRFGGKALISIGVLLVLASLYVVAVLSFYAVYRWRRRQSATEADDRVRLAWQESVEAFAMLGIAPKDSETPSEFGIRAGSSSAVDGVTELAGLLVQSSYSAEGATDDDAVHAVALSEGVCTSVTAQAPTSARVRSALDPRPPERRRPVSRRGPSSRRRGDAPQIEILRLE